MLADDQRVRSPRDFSRVVRGGRRAGTTTLVVHLMPGIEDGASRMGLIVGKAVGGAVERNRVKRRLRAVARPRLGTLPSGSLLVIRALPAAATAGSPRLGDDLDAALRRVRST